MLAPAAMLVCMQLFNQSEGISLSKLHVCDNIAKVSQVRDINICLK